MRCVFSLSILLNSSITKNMPPTRAQMGKYVTSFDKCTEK